jgi:hypothetical protein
VHRFYQFLNKRCSFPKPCLEIEAICTIHKAGGTDWIVCNIVTSMCQKYQPKSKVSVSKSLIKWHKQVKDTTSSHTHQCYCIKDWLSRIDSHCEENRSILKCKNQCLPSIRELVVGNPLQHSQQLLRLELLLPDHELLYSTSQLHTLCFCAFYQESYFLPAKAT